MKMLRSKRCVQCRHFGGYATFIRFLGQILVNYEIQQKSAFLKVFSWLQFWSARAQNFAILGLADVKMSAEVGLDVNTRKFRHGEEISNSWNCWCCNAHIKHKSGVENLSMFGFGAWSRAPPCSTGVAPSSMKMWFLKSLKKILHTTTLVCPHHIHSLRCGSIPNFLLSTDHKFKIACSWYWNWKFTVSVDAVKSCLYVRSLI